ncbi:unnamed protein product [Cunninghamella blakesleeana]
MEEVKADRENSDKRHSRRPVWRLVKFVATIPIENSNNKKYPPIPENKPIEDIYISQPSTPSSIRTVDWQKSRLSNWLSHQIQEHENHGLYSPTYIDHDDCTTVSNLSVVSHVSTDIMTLPTISPIVTPIRKRSSSLPISPTITASSSHNNKIIPSPSDSNNNHHFIIENASNINSTEIVQPTPLLLLPPSTHKKNNIIIINNDDDDDDDDDDDTYETASGSSYISYNNTNTNTYTNNNINNNSYNNAIDDVIDDILDEVNDMDDIDDMLDEVNDASSNSILYTQHDDLDDLDDLDDDDLIDANDTNVIISMTESFNNKDDDKTNNNTNNTNNNDNNNNTINNNNYLNIQNYKTNQFEQQSIYSTISVNMDAEVARTLLEWRRNSLLKIEWSNMFSVKSDLWRSSNIFNLHVNHPHHSVATSIISLDFTSIPLDKAFRSYSNKLDFSKATVTEIDQALQMFSQLYWEHNSSKLLGCAEVIYIIIHSLMKLNTDIHAGHEQFDTIESFCENTIQLILGHKSSIPTLLFDNYDEKNWIDQMTNYLETLYKSVKRTSLIRMEKQLQKLQLTKNSKERKTLQLETAFKDLFISIPETHGRSSPSNRTKEKERSTNNKRKKRSQSVYSTSSWTVVRRRDTSKIKEGPYKEGPLSCQWNGEGWHMCWVILHLGHLHIYYREGCTDSPPTKISHSTIMSSSSVSSDTTTKNKVKKKFMHLTSSSNTAQMNNYDNHNSNNNNGSSSLGKSQVKKEPYQELNIYLGNSICERIHTHAFLLQLANGNTYLFDGGSESHVTGWIHDCNYWASIETKIVPIPFLTNQPSEVTTTAAAYATHWKKPPLPAGSSVLNKQDQQKAIEHHIQSLQNELSLHLKQTEWLHTNLWQDKKSYLELEIKKYLCYHEVIIT